MEPADDISLLCVILAIGAIPVAVAALTPGAWGIGPTLGVMTTAFAGWQLLAHFFGPKLHRRRSHEADSHHDEM